MNQKLKLEPKQKLAYEFEVTRKILNLFFGSKTLHDCEPVWNILCAIFFENVEFACHFPQISSYALPIWLISGIIRQNILESFW